MVSTVKRQSAAVMFTDIAGYTSIMASDEEKALSLLKEKRKVLKPLIDKHDGIYVKGTGDGTLSYFDSAYKASKCAKLFQESIYDNKNMNVRVGIHVGDIVLDDGDVYGDGVNVASRLESMSPIGGICVSNTVYDELRNKKDFDGIGLGLQSLKGVGKLVEILGLKGKKLQEPNPQDYLANEIEIHKDDDVPSLAIIPLKNKGSHEDVFYAYGISADLIKDCSRAGSIRVESLDRIEKISGYESLDIKSMASTLSVRYIITGTLWKMKDMFQLSIELYDTKRSKVIWSDRWQESWSNLSVIQNKLADNITKAMNKTIIGKSNVSSNSEAYEYYLRGTHKFWKRSTIEDSEIAQKMLIKAIELDGNLINARILLGWTYYLYGDILKGIDIYEDTLERAKDIEDKPSIAMTLRRLGIMYSDVENDLLKGLDYVEQALSIAEEINDKILISLCLESKGAVFSKQDLYLESLECLTRALKISEEIGHNDALPQIYNNIGHHYIWSVPNYSKAVEYFILMQNSALKNQNHPLHAWSLCSIGMAQWCQGDYKEALRHFEEAKHIVENLGDKVVIAELGIWISLMHFELGNVDKARDEIEKSGKIFETVASQRNKFEFVATNIFIRRELGLDYEIKELDQYLDAFSKDKRILHCNDWFYLYITTDNIDFLDSAYKRLYELSERVDSKLRDKLFNYPLSRRIVEEWEKVK